MPKLSTILEGRDDLKVYYIGYAHFIRVEESLGLKKYIWGFEVAGYEEENGRWLMEKEKSCVEMPVSVYVGNEEFFRKTVRAADVRITYVPEEVTTYSCILEYEGEKPFIFLNHSR